jgi:hypothetical protein
MSKSKLKLVNLFGLILFASSCFFVTSCSGGGSSNSDSDGGSNNANSDNSDCPIDQPRCEARKANNIQ